MTTSVIITSPKPNHNLITVETHHVQKDGSYEPLPYPVVLDEGQSTHVYVHGFNKVVITETPKPEVES